MKLSHLLLIASLLFSLSSSAATDPGLYYSYYEGSWSAMPDFTQLKAIKSGPAGNIDLGVRNRDLNYAILWQGYITIPVSGNYTFDTNSDDGSMFYINNSSTPLVNNDGLHGDQVRSGALYLAAGVYPVTTSFFQNGGGHTMELYWTGPGISRQRVPDNAFSFYTSATTKSTTPGLNYSYFEGDWSSMPAFNLLTAVKSGASANLDLGVRNRDLNYGILWQGYITVPANGTYTFETNSDDGSMFYINNNSIPLVNNDGLHGDQLRSGSLYLAAGTYPVSASFFQSGGGHTMELYWTGPGISRQRVPDNALSSIKVSGTVPPASSANGLTYNYYEGAWASLPDFSNLKPVKTGNSSNIDLTPRNNNDNFAFMWQGYINITTPGAYTFETVSDDGSKIYFNTPYTASATALVSNDGLHGAVSATGTVNIPAAGVYPVTITFFEREGGEQMQVYWTGPGIARQLIPDAAFSSNKTISPVFETSTETGGLTGAANYYFSSSLGDDSRSAAQAQNPATPWKSVARMNALLANAAPGTTLLLKRGDSFDGALVFGTSGSASAPIIVSAYGTGTKPVINGFASNISWSAIGGGIWEAPLITAVSRINMVAKADQIQPMGRYPNITDAGMGFLPIASHSNASGNRNSVEAMYSHPVGSVQSITGAALSSATNWTGAELVIKKNRWTIDRGLITDHSGGTLTYLEPSGMEPIDGFGYFIQNDARTLDQIGEWYFNPATKKIQVYAGSTSPAAMNIRPSVIDTLVTIRSKSNITLDNIALQGANSTGIAVWDNANNVSIQNCVVDFSGVTGIKANFLNNLSLTNSVVNHTNNNALYLAPVCTNTSIKGNIIKNAGLIPGLGLSNNQTHEGLIIDGRGSVVQYNTFDSIGYVGIAITRDSVTVINNLVSNYAMITDDCGGIYTHDRGYYGRRILNNIVLNGKGCHYGTNTTEDSDAQGIGLDDLSSFVEITGNTVANCSGKGISLHNSQNIIIKDNTVFNNKTAQLEFDHDNLGPDSPTRNILVQDNVFFAKTAAQPVMTIISKNDDIAQFGTAFNNYYCRPVDDGLTFRTISLWGTSQANDQYYDLAHWRGVTAQDGSSRKSPITLGSYTVLNSGVNMISNGNFNNNIDGVMTPSPDHLSIQYDNSVLDGGALKVAYTGTNGNPHKGLVAWLFDPSNLQTMQAGRTYRLRFSIKGSRDNNTDFGAVMHSSSTGASSEIKSFKVYNTRKEVELIYTPTNTIANFYVNIYTENADNCPVWWLDNVKMEEVTLSYTNPDDYIRFEYNASVNAKTVTLNGEYVDAKNNVYSGTITLEAYSSAVLIKRSAAGLIQSQDQTQSVVATTSTLTAREELTAGTAKAMQVRVSPNPATDRIQLTHSLQVNGQTARVSVYNAGGAVVKTISVSLTNAPVSMQVSELSQGVYTVKIDCGAQSQTARFVKM